MRTYATLAVTLIATVLVGCGGGDKQSTTSTSSLPTKPTRAAPTAATTDNLRALSTAVKHDVFWAGRKRGYTYELSRTNDGSIYIRYLPRGVPVGAAGADFLSIGTYPQNDAFATITAAKKLDGESITKLPNGGVAVSNASRPQSVYFAYPGSKLLVEVYDPDPARALRLVRRNQVVPLH